MPLAGVTVALGSDWAPSGSKNLLGELKVARIYADSTSIDLSDLDLVRMATTNPARMLGWAPHLGSLEPGKRADLLVLDGRRGDPYRQLLAATEADVHLVMINGIARLGTQDLMQELMKALGPAGERIRVGGRTRVLNLAQATADPGVAAVSVAEATNRLTAALAALPNTDRRVLARLPTAPAPGRAAAAGGSLLAVADVLDNHMSPRPHLPLHGGLTGPNLPGNRDTELAAAAAPQPFPALELDPLAAVDNPDYYQALGAATNVPADIRDLLQRLGPS